MRGLKCPQFLAMENSRLKQLQKAAGCIIRNKWSPQADTKLQAEQAFTN